MSECATRVSENGRALPAKSPPMRNIRLILAYDGTDFHGWQIQPGRATVQGCLQSALERLTGNRVTVAGSGRTDAGVHALNQVANFHTESAIPCPNLAKALNDMLPPTIRVKEAAEADPGFHARYQARSKTYRYRILEAPVCPPFQCRFVHHYPYALDLARMIAAARMLEGEHDFTSFAAAGEGPVLQVGSGSSPDAPDGPERDETRSMVRTLYSSRLFRPSRGRLLVYEVRGSGFLHHMVRNMVGTLIEVGRGKLEPDEVWRILETRDRTAAGPTAPARGLFLVRVEY